MKGQTEGRRRDGRGLPAPSVHSLALANSVSPPRLPLLQRAVELMAHVGGEFRSLGLDCAGGGLGRFLYALGQAIGGLARLGADRLRTLR